MIKVIQERHVKDGKEKSLENLLIDLRAKAMRQPGYISGETMVCVDDPSVYIVIATFTNIEVWKAWECNPERMELLAMIASLLTEDPKITVFGAPIEEEP